MVDEATKKALASIPLLRTRAGPRDGDLWATRLKEEYISLIKVKALRDLVEVGKIVFSYNVYFCI